MRLARTCAFALFILASAEGCSAQYPSRPQGPILDQADILPPKAEAALDAHLSEYYQSSGNALVVVSVKSLDESSIEEYSTGLFNDWGIGNAKSNRGLLVLIAPNERKVRIEVGCGLETEISDADAADIIQNRMLPQYRLGKLDEGTLAGVESLMFHLNGMANRPKPRTRTPPASLRCRALMQVPS